jgi:hypothetical protein
MHSSRHEGVHDPRNTLLRGGKGERDRSKVGRPGCEREWSFGLCECGPEAVLARERDFFIHKLPVQVH